MSPIFNSLAPVFLRYMSCRYAHRQLTFLSFMPLSPDQQHQPEPYVLYRMDKNRQLKTREVYEPNEEVRAEHDAMLRRLYDLDIPMPNAYGGLPGRSLRDNVLPHRHNDVFYMLDIKNAYGSVDVDALRDMAQKALYRHGAGSRLQRDLDGFLSTSAVIEGVPGLPMGYPCSPYLFNLYCREMDGKLSYALSGLPWDRAGAITYTRWLDDLTFSATGGQLNGDRRAAIRQIVEGTPGFEFETRKTRRHSLGKGAITVTGLSLYPNGRVAPAPELLDKVVRVFVDAEEVLDAGGTLTDDEIDEVHGLNSILHMAGDPERSGSKLVRGLNVRYHDIARRSLGMKQRALSA